MYGSSRYENLGIHWAAALPGFIALACIPFTVMFYKYGASIRARCRYAADAEQQMNAIMAARAEQTKTDEEDNMTTEGEGGSDDTHGGDEEKEKSSEDKLHPSDPESPRHHQWTMYEELADRDGIDLNDEERMRLKTLHGKFNYEKAEPDEGRMSPREGMRDVATWTGADIREVTRSVTGLVKGNSVTSQGVGTGESLNTRWHSPDSFFALNQTTKRSATRFERFDFEPNRSVTHLDYQPDRSVTRLDQPNPSATRLEYQPDQDVDHERFVTRTRPDYSPDRSVRQERFVEQERPVGQEGFIGTQQPARQQASTVQEQSVPLNHHWRNSYFALDPPVAATHPSPTSYQNNSVQEQIFRTHHNYPSTSALGQPVAPGQESSTTLNDLPTGRRLA